MKKNKIVLFDIDYTLFDTALFRKKFQKSLAKVLNMDEKTLLEIQSGVIDQVKAMKLSSTQIAAMRLKAANDNIQQR